MNHVIAVVVSWNLRDKVLRCIESLCAQSPIEKIILVDNGSNDGTPGAVKEKFPEADVIELGQNTGFAAGSNTGIERAIGMGADFVLLANSDIVAPTNAVDKLLQAAAEEKAGAVGAKLVRADDPSRLDGAWGVINWRNFISRVEGENQPDGPAYSARTKVDYALGAFLLLRVEALNKVGLFDEEYFAYHEEMELCERLRRAGFPVIFEPVAVMHDSGASVRQAGAQSARDYLLARNSVRFARTHGDIFKKLKFSIFVMAATVLKIPIAAFTGALQSHLTNVRGWWDGLLDKPFDRKLRELFRLE